MSPAEPPGGVATAVADSNAPGDQPGDLERVGPSPCAALLSLHHFSVQRPGGDEVLVPPLDLALYPGQITGLLGPNGSGKSTLIGTLLGDRPPVGEIRWRGHAVQPAREPAFRRELGVAFQQPSLDGALSVRENLVLAAILYGTPGSAHAAHEAMERFDLGSLADRRANTLSGGEARRADLARATVHRPALLLLDEPSQGLDERVHRHVWNLLQRWVREESGSILVATHRPDVAEHCDALVLLAAARPARLTTPSLLRAAGLPDRVLLAGIGEADMRRICPAARRLSDGRFSLRTPDGAQWLVEHAEALKAAGMHQVQIVRANLADAFAQQMGVELDVQAWEEAPAAWPLGKRSGSQSDHQEVA